MAPPKIDLQPGDVLAVHTPNDITGWWIRFGAALDGKPDVSNHIAVVHHTDAHGTLWVIEGRPNGVGWRSSNDYLHSKMLLTNAAQPKTELQRTKICSYMVLLLGTPYDWEAIVADAANDLHFDWSPSPAWKGGKVPAQVVCSSLACYAYDKAGLARPPGNPRTDQPADWDQFILNRAWETA
jgi:hypothetical protein